MNTNALIVTLAAATYIMVVACCILIGKYLDLHEQLQRARAPNAFMILVERKKDGMQFTPKLNVDRLEVQTISGRKDVVMLRFYSFQQ
jgi:hypothetical protein